MLFLYLIPKSRPDKDQLKSRPNTLYDWDPYLEVCSSKQADKA